MGGPTVGTEASATNGLDHDVSSKSAGAKSSHSRRKSRRRLEQELNVAARHRRQIAAQNYYHLLPKLEDVWICEFCEYERIFGEPPRALIRDYEMKDRQHRQEEADRKRLLEKAKAKCRKGKKNGGRAPSKSSHRAHQSPDPGPPDVLGDQDAPPMHLGHSQSTQSEGDEYVEELEDEYLNMPTAPERLPAIGDGGGGGPPMRART